MPDNRIYSINQEECGADFTMRVCLDFFNQRLRVDDYQGNIGSLCRRMSEIAKEHAFTKVFVKSRREDWEAFLSRGWMLEGVYKGYYNGGDAYCMALYQDPARRTSDYWMEEDRMLQQVLELAPKPDPAPVPDGCTLRTATQEDAERLAALYRQVFRIYPTPMDDPSYIAQVMQEGTLFYLVEKDGLIISAASAEINTPYRNAEMTDCATDPAYRNRGLMRLLLHALEDELRRRCIPYAYSLSRALSFGMNAVFYQMGYRYSGRLTKNCEIYDKLEDMNLWTKTL